VRILYHLTIPPSTTPALDALLQEVEALRRLSEDGGQIVYLYPTRKLGTRIPRRWWGMQHILRVRRAEQQVDIHHIFNPDPFPLDMMRFLRRPVVYSAVAGAQGADRKTVLALAERVHTLVVPADSDCDRLREWGISNVTAIRPGIDTGRFSRTPPPPVGGPFTLLMASAPWTVDQFESKGVKALLDAAHRRTDLRLIFLWRGLHLAEMEREIATRALGGRVTVVNRVVDVSEALAQAHAVVVLASSPRLVKAFPHSLLEALASGRPVLVSRAIPMASYVEQNGCGRVVEAVNADAVLEALAHMEADYSRYRTAALRVGPDLDERAFVEAYKRLYDSIGQG
jgi:glycosyltransferase involved in cell wall biosynthesis